MNFRRSQLMPVLDPHIWGGQNGQIYPHVEILARNRHLRGFLSIVLFEVREWTARRYILTGVGNIVVSFTVTSTCTVPSFIEKISDSSQMEQLKDILRVFLSRLACKSLLQLCKLIHGNLLFLVQHLNHFCLSKLQLLKIQPTDLLHCLHLRNVMHQHPLDPRLQGHCA
jgi:hypothetical protein